MMARHKRTNRKPPFPTDHEIEAALAALLPRNLSVARWLYNERRKRYSLLERRLSGMTIHKAKESAK